MTLGDTIDNDHTEQQFNRDRYASYDHHHEQAQASAEFPAEVRHMDNSASLSQLKSTTHTTQPDHEAPPAPIPSAVAALEETASVSLAPVTAPFDDGALGRTGNTAANDMAKSIDAVFSVAMENINNADPIIRGAYFVGFAFVFLGMIRYRALQLLYYS